MPRWLTLDSPARTALWWAATRLVVIGLWIGPENLVRGDVDYYFNRIHMLFTGTPPTGVLMEYPVPVVWLLTVPYGLGLANQTGFLIAFMTLFVALDGLILLLVWRTARRRGSDPTPAAWTWIAFVLAMGPITYLRLDLLTAACSVLAVLALGRARAGALTGVGAAIKLWPAVLWPATMTDRRQVVRSTIAFAATGGVLAVASLLWTGWGRLVSPLTWQSDRGLQIESLWATPAMLAHLGDAATYRIDMSKYQAFEIFGPLTQPLLRASSYGTIVGGLVIVGLYVLWLRRPNRTLAEAGLLMVAATAIMIVTNKTFSPQYLIWLAGPLAATLALTPSGPSPARRLLGRAAAGTLVLTLATQLVYPLLYDYLIGYKDGPLVWVAQTLLAARNIGLAGLTVWLIATLVHMLMRRGNAGRDDGSGEGANE